MVFSLVADAEAQSGVGRDEACGAVDEVNLYERMGETVLKDIATAFYDRVYADKHELSTSGESIRGVFANTTKADAIDSHFRFLVERLGGPSLYTSTKGAFQLIGRHAPYAGVNEESGERWLFHMEAALRSVQGVDADSRERLMKFFRFHAAYIVLGKQYVNGTRLLGGSYGQAPFLGAKGKEGRAGAGVAAPSPPPLQTGDGAMMSCPAAAMMLSRRGGAGAGGVPSSAAASPPPPAAVPPPPPESGTTSRLLQEE